MADTRVPALADPTGGADPADLLYLVDVSDTTDHASGSSRKVSLTQLGAVVTAVIDGGYAGGSTPFAPAMKFNDYRNAFYLAGGMF